MEESSRLTRAEQQRENSSLESRYGWFSYTPHYLQLCLSPRWILFTCCWLVFTETFIVTGLSGAVVTSLEKRYFLRSSQIGGIYATYDISGVLMILAISYFGHANKPRWLGVGSFLLSIGSATFLLPHLLAGSYEPITAQSTDLCQNNQTLFNATHPTAETCRNPKWHHVLVFVLGQLLIGAGASPIFNLGPSYLDANVSNKASGVYLGIFYAVSTLGAGLGYLLAGYFLSVYVDITLPDGVDLKQDDNSWIGAWWLGYLFGGAFALLVGIPLLGFPKEVPRVRILNEQKKKAIDAVPDERKPHTAGEFFPTLKSLLTNKVFLFTAMAGAMEGLAVSGLATFFPKFLESQFYLSSSYASLYAGIVIIPGGVTGMLLGGCVTRKLQWTCVQCAKGCAIVAFFALFPILVFLVHCPNKHLAGVTTPHYFNRTTYGSLDDCSTTQNCSCKQYNYFPICTKEDHITYFSPCHAGCKTETKLDGDVVYMDCSCLSPNITVAYSGSCQQSCNSLRYFLPISFVFIVLTFFNNIPAVTVTLRCVPESQGSFALGVQQIISKLLAYIPAPIIYGALLDSVCILSGTDPCEDAERNCLEYKNDNLSYVFFAVTMTCKVLSFLFFTLAWLVYKPPKHTVESKLELSLCIIDTSNSLGNA